ncbi:ADOP family duplicated permease [Dokdonella sp.]|uniref:ADOP family duplicated permease n=1 Tax=Dokdonella sp. TaxID=2291710 RepID=UPI00262E0376|nr:ADOP family duplicated permease [Dokdonella sp.]
MNAWIHDLRRGARSALRHRGFVALAGATLALGIGACAAVFALVDAVLLAPPPFPQPDRLVVLDKSDGHPWSTISPQQYQLLDGVPGIESLGSKFAPKDVNVAGSGDPELVTAWPVDAGLLPTLGVAPALGRNFSRDEDRPNGPRAALIGHAFWQRHFNGDQDVIGRSVLVDGVATPIVGVLPATFRLDGSPDVLLPLALAPNSRDGATNLLVVARLAPGASLAAASTALDARLQAHAGELGFANARWRPRFSATSIAQNLSATARPVLLLFLGCAACVLLLVAVNLSNLMLLRALARGHDSAVRSALGASTAQLALPALGEGLLIGGIGALGGLALAAVALHVAQAWLPAGWLDPQAAPVAAHTIALAFAAAIAVAVLATLFGVWRGRSGAATRELAAGTRMGTSVATQRFGRLLVVAQASLATLLLASSALLAHSLWKLSRVDLGFDASGVVTFRLNPAAALYPDSAAVQRFAQSLLERLRAEPGVREAALTTTLPIGPQFNVSMRLPDGSSPEAPQYRAVSTRSFATFAIPLVAGRVFAESDRAGAEPVAIVNAAFAQRYLHGEAIGQSIKVDDGDELPMPLMRIVGVVGDVRQFGPQEDAPPIVYVPLAQVPDGLFNLVRQFVPLNAAIRVDGAPAAYAERLRAVLREVDARQGVAGLRLFERDVADATPAQRMNAALVGLFATLAVLLAGVGLYSVTAVAVTARRREYGVRAALGAAPSRLMRGVLRSGLVDVGLGLAFGLAAALAGGRLLQGFLFGVDAADPLALAATFAVLLAAGLVATALPALRAARVDPMTALRND